MGGTRRKAALRFWCFSAFRPPNSGAGLLRKAKMQNQDPGQLAKFHAAQNSAEIAHARLCGGGEIPVTEIPSIEDLWIVHGALHRALNTVRGLLGIGGPKGGAA